MDATISPIFTTDEGTVLQGEYRHLLPSGQYEFSGSITNPQKRAGDTGVRLPGHEVRGHIEGHGAFRLSDTWGWGFDGTYVSDDTYLRRYEFSKQDMLTSRVYLEGIKGRSYAGIEGLTFRGLSINDDPAREPLILPLATAYTETHTRCTGRSLVHGGQHDGSLS